MSRGYTLLEVMVVVVVMSIMTLLVIPGILRSRMLVVETLALSNIKFLSNAIQTYNINTHSYPADLAALKNTTDSGMYNIDPSLAAGHKHGYDFIYNRTGKGFTLLANPTGIFSFLNGNYFYVDETTIVRSKHGSQAGPKDEKTE